MWLKVLSFWRQKKIEKSKKFRMIPMHEIVIKISNPTNNYTYTAISELNLSTTSRLLGSAWVVVCWCISISVSIFCFNCNSSSVRYFATHHWTLAKQTHETEAKPSSALTGDEYCRLLCSSAFKVVHLPIILVFMYLICCWILSLIKC